MLRPLVKPCCVIILLALAGCPGACPAQRDGGVLEPWPLDTELGEGEVRCGPVTTENELIGGRLAYGQVGHAWRCSNSKIRFLIQGSERPFGNSSIGGNLIDVDLVRGDESMPGQDEFREHVVAFGIHESSADSIEVIDDGRTGETGIIRVSGLPGDLTLAPQAAILAQDMPVRMQTDYILRPDSDVIEVKTTLFNESDDQLYGLLFADFVAFGGGNQTLAPSKGFNDIDFFSIVPFLAAGGSETSYAWVCADGTDPAVIFAESGITGPSCTDDVIVTMEASYSRLLVVGDGTIESVSKRAWELKGVATGTISGVVTDAAGTPALGVMVAAVTGGAVTSDDAYVVNRTRTDENGAYTLTLAPSVIDSGEVEIVAFVPGAQRVSSGLIVPEVDTDATVDLQLEGSGYIDVNISFLDRTGAALGALPAKITIEALEGAYVPSTALNEYRSGNVVRSEPTAAGSAVLSIAPGRYRVWASRGFEFTRESAEVDVVAGETVSFEATLQHVVDTTGLVGGEFHQHTLASTDAVVPIPLKVLENAAEGVEVAASTDHDNVQDFAPVAEELGVAAHLTLVPGDEVSFQAVGHINVYPWTVDGDDPFADTGSRLWWGKSFPTLFADLRERAGDPIIQLNHVRSAGSGTLASMLFNPIDGTRTIRSPPSLPGLAPDIYASWSSNFDAIEINRDTGNVDDFTDEGRARLSANAANDPGAIPALADYFGLLGSGLAIGATAVSDSHNISEGVGWPRTMLDVGVDDPAAVTPAMITTSIRTQQTSGAHGCLIELLIGNERKQGLVEAVPSDDLADLRLRVQAPSWVPMTQLEVYANGRVLTLADVTDAVVVDAQASALTRPLTTAAEGTAMVLDVPLQGLPSGDLVVMVVVRGGDLSPTAPSSALCWSAPLYVQEGGTWEGWLADTQSIIP